MSRPLRIARLLLASAPILAALQACGRSEPGDYLFDDEDTSGRGGSSTTTGGVSVAGTRPGKGGAQSTGGVVMGGSTGIGGTGIIAGAGGKTSGGAGGASGSGGQVMGGSAGQPGGGAAGEPSVPEVSCGDDLCDSATERCCVSVAGFACIANGTACNGAVLDCSAARDCPAGNVCCLSFTSPTGSASTCKDRCAGANQDLERQLCSTDAECRGNRRCASTVFGVSVCTRAP